MTKTNLCRLGAVCLLSGVVAVVALTVRPGADRDEENPAPEQVAAQQPPESPETLWQPPMPYEHSEDARKAGDFSKPPTAEEWPTDPGGNISEPSTLPSTGRDWTIQIYQE